MALMCSHMQANPTVERVMPIKRHKKKNKSPQSKATQMKNQQQQLFPPRQCFKGSKARLKVPLRGSVHAQQIPRESDNQLK